MFMFKISTSLGMKISAGLLLTMTLLCMFLVAFEISNWITKTITFVLWAPGTVGYIWFSILEGSLRKKNTYEVRPYDGPTLESYKFPISKSYKDRSSSCSSTSSSSSSSTSSSTSSSPRS